MLFLDAAVRKPPEKKKNTQTFWNYLLVFAAGFLMEQGGCRAVGKQPFATWLVYIVKDQEKQ